MMRSTPLLLAALLMLPLTALSQPGNGRMIIRKRVDTHESMMEKLKLSDQQQAQMRKLRLEFAKKEVQLHAKIQLARLDMRDLIGADQPDRSAIEKQVKEISDLQYQQKLDLIDHLFAVKAILTPDQVKIWKEQLKERHGMFREQRMGTRRRQGMMGEGMMGGGMMMGQGMQQPGSPDLLGDEPLNGDEGEDAAP